MCQSIREVGLDTNSYFVYLFDGVPERERTPEVKAWLADAEVEGRTAMKRMRAERRQREALPKVHDRIVRSPIIEERETASTEVKPGIFSELARQAKEEQLLMERKGMIACKMCGKMFTPSRASAIYCSRRCCTNHFNETRKDYYRAYRIENADALRQKAKERYQQRKEEQQQINEAL